MTSPYKQWPEALSAAMDKLLQEHSALSLRERRARSWSRSIAFAQAALAGIGKAVKHTDVNRPLKVWVLGATNEVEVWLAEEGFFGDANCVDRVPTEVTLLGGGLRELSVGSQALEGHPAVVRTRDYQAIAREREDDWEPDLAVLFMPEVRYDNDLDRRRPSSLLPSGVLTALGSAPVAVTMRFELPARSARELESALGEQLLVAPTRCPFSSSCSAQGALYDDNGWLFVIQGPGALPTSLDIKVWRPSWEVVEEADRSPAEFWGIIDLKYDPAKPVFERVKVLETGDGRISKFSGDGADIQRRAEGCYRLDEGPGMRKYHTISADKRFTHDLIEQSGYGHLVPSQVCFPRQYDPGLAARIIEGLGAVEEAIVLKLCNRSRAAGVLVVPIEELDEVLEEILVPPTNTEAWFRPHIAAVDKGSAADLGVQWGSFEEQIRHWWANESPSFVAERWCTSMPTVHDGRHFDGTMRIGFALRRRSSMNPSELTTEGSTPKNSRHQHTVPEGVPQPEDLEVDWLGGYWKLPKRDMNSPDLRERVISAARTSGTAPVALTHLFEVYAALGNSVQRLFGSAEPTSQMLAAQYAGQPELAAYLTARLALSARDPAKVRKMLWEAQSLIRQVGQGPGRLYVESFIERGYGVVEAKTGSTDRWQQARPKFVRSLALHPMNANSLFLLGMATLESGNLPEALDILNKSVLLDPDFKAPYVNLGVAYLRSRRYDRVLDISDACLSRYPQSPQCMYHIGVACCELALRLEAKEARGSKLLDVEVMEYEELCNRALETLREARASKEAQSRRRGTECPWLPSDDKMLAVLSFYEKRANDSRNKTVMERHAEPHPRLKVESFDLPQNIGWRVYGWRV